MTNNTLRAARGNITIVAGNDVKISALVEASGLTGQFTNTDVSETFTAAMEGDLLEVPGEGLFEILDVVDAQNVIVRAPGNPSFAGKNFSVKEILEILFGSDAQMTAGSNIIE